MPPDNADRETGGRGSDRRARTVAAPVVDIVVMLAASAVGEGRALLAGGQCSTSWRIQPSTVAVKTRASWCQRWRAV
ncbi:hypothetical protein ABZ767_20385 [Streptomyces pseudogriseolus]|uniref:hypothetical protein n=1 Tax=Streptomyces pseudogriseolus TaxID=36817 RepID=UPI00347F2CFC